jgi:hypothetical protein
MSEESIKFRANNSVLSKINGVSDPTSAHNLTDVPSKSNNDTNAKITDNQNNLSSREADGLNKINNSPQPAKGSDGLSIDSMKNESKKQPQTPKLESIKTQKVEATSDENGNVKSNIVEGNDIEERGWLENRLMEATGNMMSGVIEGNRNVEDPKNAEKPNTEPRTKSTPKSTVGKVPALDIGRPSPEIPGAMANREIPSPKMSSKNASGPLPKINIPKMSIPKMKFR